MLGGAQEGRGRSRASASRVVGVHGCGHMRSVLHVCSARQGRLDGVGDAVARHVCSAHHMLMHSCTHDQEGAWPCGEGDV